MKILILGGDGMLGHRLVQHFAVGHEVRYTVRREAAAYTSFALSGHGYFGVEATNVWRLMQIMVEFRPDAMVNCIGIVKQRDDAKSVVPSVEINALLPHRLTVLCRSVNARLVHVSTDCVFSGARGDTSRMTRAMQPTSME